MELASFFSTPSYPISSFSICTWRSRCSILVPPSSIFNQVTPCFSTWYRGMFIHILLCMNWTMNRFIDWIIPLPPFHPVHCQRRSRPWDRHPPSRITFHQYAYDSSRCSSSSSNASLTQYHPRGFTFNGQNWVEAGGIGGPFLWDFHCGMDCTRLRRLIWVDRGWRWWFSHQQNRSFGARRSYTYTYIRPFRRSQFSLSRTMDHYRIVIIIVIIITDFLTLVFFLLRRFSLAIMVFRKSRCRCSPYIVSFFLLVRRWDVERRSGCFSETKEETSNGWCGIVGDVSRWSWRRRWRFTVHYQYHFTRPTHGYSTASAN